MAKPMAVTLPFILLLLDIYPLKRIPFPKGIDQNLGVLLEKIPLCLLSFTSAILTVLAQRAGGAFESFERLPIHFRLLNALHTPLFYIGRMIWPVKLLPYYPFPTVIHFFDLAYYCIAVILVLSVTGWCIWIWRRGKCLILIAWAYYLITLLPVVGIIQVGSQAAADRYTYLPSFSIFLLAGAGVAQLFAKFAGRKNTILVAGLCAALIFAAFAQLTVKQIKIWQESEILWRYVIQRFPGRVPVANNNLGVLYDGRGLHDKALDEYEKTIAINPTFADAHNNLGVAYKRKGNYEKAIEQYEKALASNPNMVEARNNLGLAYYAQEMDDKAVKEYEKALAINPAFAEAHYKLGLIYYEKKNYASAKTHIDRARELGYKIDPKLTELIKQAP